MAGAEIVGGLDSQHHQHREDAQHAQVRHELLSGAGPLVLAADQLGEAQPVKGRHRAQHHGHDHRAIHQVAAGFRAGGRDGVEPRPAPGHRAHYGDGQRDALQGRAPLALR